MDLNKTGHEIATRLDAHRHPGALDGRELLDIQVLCIAEEAGELVKAYRRWSGGARQPGSRQEVEEELADLIICTATAAAQFGIDLEQAVAAKLTVVYDRLT